jgi:hypothetical protein
LRNGHKQPSCRRQIFNQERRTKERTTATAALPAAQKKQKLIHLVTIFSIVVHIYCIVYVHKTVL